VPDSEQGSASASGTYTSGAYAEEAWVTPGCLDAWVREHLDSMGDYGSVLRYGVAWLRRYRRAAYDRHLAAARSYSEAVRLGEEEEARR